MKKDTAKYTIHVTIFKFLEQGGELTKGRCVFSRIESSYNDYYPCGGYVKTDNKTGRIIIKNGEKRFPISDMFFYVEIPVKPIYK
jgi:hypothetical protein